MSVLFERLEEDEEATCGRVEYGRSARRSDCCDDGPLTFTRRLNGCLIPSSSQVEGAWGGAGTPPLNFQKIEGAGEGSPPPRWKVFQRDADIRSSVVWHEYGYSSRE